MRAEEKQFKFDEILQEVLESNVSEDSKIDEAGEEDEVEEEETEEAREERSILSQVGGAPSWYDKDTTEVDGYGRLIKKPNPPVRPPDSEPLPCFDMKDTLYIPSSNFTINQLYGICNIKFDTTDISKKQKPGLSTSLPKDVMQVILMAVFIYKLRFNMQSYGLRITNLNNYPFIISGLFRDDMVIGSNDNPILNTALKLLTTDKTTKWRQNINETFGGKKGSINKFVINMIILTYLRVGKIRVAGFHPIHRNFNPKLIGDIYPLEQRSGSGSSRDFM